MASPFDNYNASPKAISAGASPWAGKAQDPMASPERSAGLPWGSTFLNDLIIRPEFAGSVLEEFFVRAQFVQSGIIQRNTAMDMTAGGVVVNVPFFKEFVAFEEAIDSGDTWGESAKGYLSPQRINMSNYQVPVVHRGWAAAADDISRLGSGEDPLSAIRSYIAGNMAKNRQEYLLALLDAVFDESSGALAGNSLGDLGAATGTSSADTTAANHISAAKVIEAQNLLGERGSDLSVIAMHSAVYNQLKVQGLLTFSSPAAPGTTSDIVWGGGGIGVSNTEIAYFAGMRIVVSDELVLSKAEAGGDAGDAYKYPVYVFAPGSVQEGVQSGLRIEADRQILSKQDVISLDYHYLLGIPGISWGGTVGGVFPKNDDIADPTNWTLAWGHREYVPIVHFIVNSPFGGNYAA